MDFDIVALSRLQFALTALYHFIFVPLTLGLSVILAIMETVYVMTNRPIWRDMTKFWGVLFGINFAMGVATGIVMEFQFGMNWSYYSHYVGDIFGAPLAIEGLMAFFLESTFIGLFFFGWDRLTRQRHMPPLTIARCRVQLFDQRMTGAHHADKPITEQGLHAQLRRGIVANHPGFQINHTFTQGAVVAVDLLHKAQPHAGSLGADMRQ